MTHVLQVVSVCDTLVYKSHSTATITGVCGNPRVSSGSPLKSYGRYRHRKLVLKLPCQPPSPVRQAFHEDRGRYLYMASVFSPVCCGSFQLPPRESKPIHGVQQHHPQGPPGIQGGWLEGLRLGLSASSVSSTRGRLVSPQPAALHACSQHSHAVGTCVATVRGGITSVYTSCGGVDVALPLGTPGRATGIEVTPPFSLMERGGVPFRSK